VKERKRLDEGLLFILSEMRRHLVALKMKDPSVRMKFRESLTLSDNRPFKSGLLLKSVAF